MSQDSTFISIEESDLTWAVGQGLLNKAEESGLWAALVKRAQSRNNGGLNVAQVAFYFGTLIIIGALTWFMTVAWRESQLLFFLALAYTAGFGTAGIKLWFDGKKLGIPPEVGGLFVTVAVSLAPIATFAAQRYLNFYWPEHDHGLFLELTAIVGGGVALYYVRFPFLMAPVAVAMLGLAAFDMPLILFGEDPTLFEGSVVSFVFGLSMTALGFYLDHVVRPSQDFGFWLYIFGSMASFGGLSALEATITDPYNVAFAVFSVLNLVRPRSLLI